jgi:hypothetical protein
MAHLVVLSEDGPLGQAGTHVWVDDAESAKTPAPRKATPKKHADKS